MSIIQAGNVKHEKLGKAFAHLNAHKNVKGKFAAIFQVNVSELEYKGKYREEALKELSKDDKRFKFYDVGNLVCMAFDHAEDVGLTEKIISDDTRR